MVGSRVWKRRSPTLDLGPGQGVQQRRLAGVGVAGEGDPRQRGAPRAGPASRRGCARAARGGGAARRSGCGRGGGRSRSGSRPGPWCRCRRPCGRRRGARGGSRAPACGPCCIRAGPARPAACPRPSGRGRRRCRGSPRCGRSPARPARASRLRSWRGASSSSQATRLASPAAISRFQLLQPAAAEVAVGVGFRALLGGDAGGRDAGGPQQLLQLGQRLGLVLAAVDDPDRQRALARARIRDAGAARRRGAVAGLGLAAVSRTLHSGRLYAAARDG